MGAASAAPTIFSPHESSMKPSRRGRHWCLQDRRFEMTGPEFKKIREDLGEAIGRPLTAADMAKLCGLTTGGADTIRRWEVSGPKPSMIELLRTNNPVLISWLRALLSENGIDMVVLDSHTSVLEGSTFAIPRRIMVADEDYERAW